MLGRFRLNGTRIHTDFHGFFYSVELRTGSGVDFVEAMLETDKALFLI